MLNGWFNSVVFMKNLLEQLTIKHEIVYLNIMLCILKRLEISTVFEPVENYSKLVKRSVICFSHTLDDYLSDLWLPCQKICIAYPSSEHAWFWNESLIVTWLQKSWYFPGQCLNLHSVSAHYKVHHWRWLVSNHLQ